MINLLAPDGDRGGNVQPVNDSWVFLFVYRILALSL